MTRVKFLFITLLITLLAGCCVWTTQARQAVNRTFPEGLRDHTVAFVQIDDDEKGRHIDTPYCSGVWVGYDVILTAAHCVDYDDPYGFFKLLGADKPDPLGREVLYLVEKDVPLRGDVNPDDARHGKVTVFEKEIDLALITVDQTMMPRRHTIAWVERGPIKIGDNAHIMGHTVGYWWTYHKGIVSNERWTDGPHDSKTLLFQLSVVTWSGNSGCGAWNDAGHLIGISSWINTRASSMSFVVHRDTIVDFLSRNRVTR